MHLLQQRFVQHILLAFGLNMERIRTITDSIAMECFLVFCFLNTLLILMYYKQIEVLLHDCTLTSCMLQMYQFPRLPGL